MTGPIDVPVAGRRTLLTGWFSFLHGETTAGDVLALRHVQARLDQLDVPYDTAWSPGYRPRGPETWPEDRSTRREPLGLDDVDPADYSDLLFVCGPLHGGQVADLHRRFAHCHRVAVGTSALTPGDPAVAGFHRVLARDGPLAEEERLDLAASAPPVPPVPVTGVVLTHGQREYGDRRRHGPVAETVTDWLAEQDCARVELDTRLDAGDWRHATTSGQFLSVLERLDLVVTDRLHGLVLALRSGVPALAVDPVDGGAKVSAQARACRWPALLTADRVAPGELERWWRWCLGPGRELADVRRRELFARRPGGSGTAVGARAG